MPAPEVTEVTPPLLEVRGLSCSYGPLQVLFDVDLAVPQGGRVALLGTNGAGKSTLLRVIAGLVEPSAGSVLVGGRDVTALRPDARVGVGMTLVEGGRAMFPGLTVKDNLRLGSYGFLRDRARVDQRLDEVLELFPQIRPRLMQPAGTLSGGEQQMVAFGRALMADPRLLLIDELSIGLAPVVMQGIVAAVERLTRERDITLLIVEQSLNVALSLVEQAYFMEKGEIRFAGSPADLLERGDLVRSVFFGPAAEAVG
ncbi:MAG: ABC-type branched-chain amino acid transport system, ATPase component [Acidimicrobiales bacterium]|jgi:ABC-type branched-subunit amino acid transport system ATPase component|nr:ABC-type branched-chain amino acid transport system, ATPase component [Acidimicrobiales bacterium]